MNGSSPSRPRADAAAFLTSPSKRTSSDHGPHDSKRQRPTAHANGDLDSLPDYARRVIIALDLDAFYVSACRKRDPSLIGIPIGIQQKALVATISYEARAAGVDKLDSIKDALKKCPDMVLVNGEDLTYFRQVSSQVWRLVRSVVWHKRVEKLGMDELFCDVTEMIDHHLKTAAKGRRYFDLNPPSAGEKDQQYGFEYDAWPNEGPGHVFPQAASDHLNENQPDWWQERMLAAAHLAFYLRQRISDEVGLTCSAGVAPTKSLAKLVGALNKPNQQTTFAPPIASSPAGRLAGKKQEARLLHHITEFLDPLDLRKLPGYGRVVVEKIRDHLHPQATAAAQRGPKVRSNFMEPTSVSDEETHGGGEVASSKPRLMVGTTRKMLSLQEMVDLFGDVTGPRLWALVCGRDAEPVVPAPDFPLQISIEDTYPYPSLRGAAIHSEIYRLSLSLLRRLELELVLSERSSTDREKASQPIDVRTDSGVVRDYKDAMPATAGKATKGKAASWVRYPLKLRLSVRQGWNNRVSKQALMPVEIFELEQPREVRAGAMAKACKTLLRALIGGDDVVGDGMNLINIAALELSDKRPQRALGSFFASASAGTERSIGASFSKMPEAETGEIDAAVLASLPAELREEIMAEYGLGASLERDPGLRSADRLSMVAPVKGADVDAGTASLRCATCGEAMEVWMQHDHELYPLLGLPVESASAHLVARSRSSSPPPSTLIPSQSAEDNGQDAVVGSADDDSEQDEELEQCKLCGEALRPWMLTAHSRFHEMEDAFG
ncbi:related to DNA Polymerase iota (POLI) [Moesziomyces antarcticus]|nr:related to DNA Polymerase iota (POLI) [Moesziomyces antarcticus]